MSSRSGLLLCTRRYVNVPSVQTCRIRVNESVRASEEGEFFKE